MWYQPNTGPSNFSDPNYVPVFLDDLSDISDPNNICNGSKICLEDLLILKDPNKASSTLDAIEYLDLLPTFIGKAKNNNGLFPVTGYLP